MLSGRSMAPTRWISALRASGAGGRQGSKDEGKADGFVSLHDAEPSASDWEVLLNSKK
jgi:hypothetical protein